MAANPRPAVDGRVAIRLADLVTRLDATAATTLGFPAASDLDWSPLARVFTAGLVNHLGDPGTDGLYPRHAKDMERDAVEMLADLFRAPAGDRWGYVTGGATEALLHGVWLARRHHPRAVVLHSAAAHPAVAKAVDVVGMPSIVVGTDGHGELNYTDLAGLADRYRHRPIVVVATAGTTWTEAVDDVRRIHQTLDRVPIPTGRQFVIVDAALSGIPLALLDPADRPGFDLHDGADLVVVSGHKFLATPMPCAALLTRASLATDRGTAVPYTQVPDTTLSSSRSGHAAVALWYALTVLGRQGLAARAAQSRDLAGYLHTRLDQMGWLPDRRPWAMTVTLAAPPAPVRTRWHLPVRDGRSHIVCAPGVTRPLLDTFLACLSTTTMPTTTTATTDGAGAGGGLSRLLPRPRRAADSSRAGGRR